MTTQSRRALETHPLHAQRAEEGSVWCWRPPVHAQHVEERAEAQRRRGANTVPTEANSLGKMDSLDDDGEKKLEERTHSG